MMLKLAAANLGLGIGLAVVSGVAQTVATVGPPAPTFDHNVERYTSKTFKGRWLQMLTNFDPSSLVKSDAEIREAADDPKAAVEKYGNEGLWKLKSLKESAVHPDTGEIIPAPFRMSGYVPFNGPVCVAMMVSQGTGALLFWNWANQSQNALVNYFNRNAASPMTTEQLALSYGTAVSAALAVAFGVSQLVKRRYSPEQAKRLLTFVAFPASMVASCSNAFIMRRQEITTGIPVTDEEGRQLSNTYTQKAAKRAVTETVTSRAILQVPVFFIPPLLLAAPPLAGWAAASSAFATGAMAFLTTVSFGIGGASIIDKSSAKIQGKAKSLPAAVAVFPVRGQLPLSSLEPALQQELAGRPAVYYNKGL